MSSRGKAVIEGVKMVRRRRERTCVSLGDDNMVRMTVGNVGGSRFPEGNRKEWWY